MAFKKGESGNPNGRPIGAVSPLTKARAVILRIFENHEEEFEEALEADIKSDGGVVRYYHTYVAPLLPKSLEVSGDMNHTHKVTSKSEVMEQINDLEKTISKKHKNRKNSTRG